MTLEGPEIDEATVTEWLDRYRQAWVERDTDSLSGLFSADIEYIERRFMPALKGLDQLQRYWTSRIVDNQRDIEFSFEIWAVRPPEAYYQWQARFVWLPINGIMELDGAGKLTFERTDDGLLCRRFEEWIDRRDV